MAEGQELVTTLGMRLAHGTMQTLRFFQTQMGNVSKSIENLIAPIVAVKTALIGLSKVMGEQANELDQLSQKTGISAEKIQEWEYAATKVGVSVSSVTSDLQRMTTAMDSPIPGEFNQGLFMLGVSTHKANGEMKTSSDILDDLSNRLSKMNVKRAQQWGAQVGISEDTVMLLRQGRDGLAKLKQEAHDMGAIIPTQQIKAMADFNNTMNAMWRTTKALSASFIAGLVPSLMKVIAGIREWQMKSGNLINKKLEIFGQKIGKVFEIFAKILGVLGDKASKIGKFFKPFTDALEETNILSALLATGIGILVGSAFVKLISMLTPLKLVFLAVAIVVEELYQWFTYGWEYTVFYLIWQKLKKWWNESSLLLKTIITILSSLLATKLLFAGYALAIKGVGIAFNGVSKAVKIFSSALKLLSMSPAFLIIALIVLTIQQLYTLFTKGWDATILGQFFKWLEKKFPNASQSFKDGIQTWKENIEAFADKILYLWDKFKEFINWVKDKATSIIGGFVDKINGVVDGVKSLLGLKEEDSNINTTGEPSATIAHNLQTLNTGGGISRNANTSILSSPLTTNGGVLSQPATTLIPEMQPINTDELAMPSSMSLAPITEITNNNNSKTTNNNVPMNVTIMAGNQDVGQLLTDLRQHGNQINVINPGLYGGGLIQ